MATPLVYAIVLNWNRCDDTLACLASLHAVSYDNLRIVLVDNGSTDGTVAAVTEQFPDVDIVVNAQNLGFARGCNVGIRYALEKATDYVFLLNNDTLVAPDVLDHLVAVMQRQPDVGMAAPKIYYADAPERIWAIGGKRHPLTLEMTGEARGVLDRGQWSQILDRDYFVGCALLISRRLLQEVGMFDPYFFMYYEDFDLSYRARQAGFRLLMVPPAKIWHKVSMSSGGSDSPNERYWMARSSVYFFRKHARGWRLGIVIPYRAGSAIKTLLRLMWRRRWPSAWAYVRGLWAGLRDAAFGRTVNG